ncbi:GntR family transcriptional regulator, partial [Mesorhizobium sp. B1-1-5]
MANGGDQTNLREQAYASFTRHLLARYLKPGQFVSQRGMQLAHIAISLIREAFQCRLFMEREAVALFTVSASDDELARLRREHEDMLAQALAQTPTPEMEARAQTIDWAMH